MKLFLLLASILTLAKYSNAQSEQQPERKLKIGISAGVNFMRTPAVSYIDITPGFKNYAKARLAVGAAGKLKMEYIASEHFSLQPEVGFAYYHPRQVYSTSPDNAYNSGRNTDNIHVTAITVGNMFKYRTRYFTVMTGPQMDFALSAKTKALWRRQGSVGVVESDFEINFKEENKMVVPSFNWIFGAEHNITNRLAIQATYQLGLSKYANTHTNWKIGKISGLYIGGAYQF